MTHACLTLLSLDYRLPDGRDDFIFFFCHRNKHTVCTLPFFSWSHDFISGFSSFYEHIEHKTQLWKILKKLSCLVHNLVCLLILSQKQGQRIFFFKNLHLYFNPCLNSVTCKFKFWWNSVLYSYLTGTSWISTMCWMF